MKTRKKITIGVIVAFLAVVMVGYIYLFTGAKISNGGKLQGSCLCT